MVRPTIVDIDSNESLFCTYSITINKCSGICNTTSDPYARICVPDFVKDINVKVFNLISNVKNY